MSIGKLYIDGKEAGEIVNAEITVKRDVERSTAYIGIKRKRRKDHENITRNQSQR